MTAPKTQPPVAKPLYAQVRDSLVRRLVDGIWSPGAMLPSETELARELNVSQGTVRKALDVMTSENLLIRRQGRGTFVAVPEDSRILFQFFRLKPDVGASTFPQSTVISQRKRRATRAERESLEIPADAEVWRIDRIRTLDDRPVLVETISLPVVRFPDFGAVEDVPNNLYQLYSSRWRVTIAEAAEKLKAIAASPSESRHLRCDVGTPLLLIGRVARDLEGHAVELRWSRCLTDHVHYAINLR